MASPTALPAGPGVYAIFARDGRALVESIGYQDPMGRPHWTHDDFVHLYTGESYGLRGRVLDHLTTGVDRSNLRLTLLALAHRGMPPFSLGALTGQADNDEAAMTEWFRESVVVGFKSCGYVKDAESAVLNATPSPMNIAGREVTDFASWLRGLREEFKRDVAINWPKCSPYQKHRR